ncbi:MAG TPA: S8 family serine peptidase [Candidatus Paceibacterota bacterium]|nr:S8 family serine peptidase [Verrucomicrobiota bacterium]HSA11643.1 S8 family serine peptidase [Candidatus Paceibacterota bacterium]
MKTFVNLFFSAGGLPRCARFVSAGLLFAALAIQAAAGQVNHSILKVAAAGVGLPPAGRDFTQLAPGQDFTPNQLLVRFASGVESAQRAQILSTLGGAQIVREYGLVPNLCLIALPAGQTVEQALLSYNANPGVLYAEPDYWVEADATFPNDPRFNELWGMLNTGQTGGTPGADIRASEAWDVTTGSRQILVAVIDTGVDYTHPDLTNNIWTNLGETPGDGLDNDGNGYVDDVHGYDFYANDGDPMDEDEHGTHCAGTIGGEGNNTLGVVGVCWQVQIMPVRFLGPFGGSTADGISSVQYATQMGARVMNNSWGGGAYSQALKDAIDAAGAANIVFTAAAGNSGTDNDIIPHYPSSYTSSNIVAVMSTDHNDLRSDFSCFGLISVDLAAPGSDILSCRPGGGYQYMSGTSMATPHVSGACALLLAANPTLTVAEIKDALLSTVDPVVPGLCVSGGRLNLFRAFPTLLPKNPLVLHTNYLSGGNGNGIIEFNECNNLSLILNNVGSTNVTGISATLSTTTPGVAIAQPNSAYANIPISGLGTNLVPFRISTVPSFICGTPIEMSLLVRSDQGVSILEFSLPTGVPGTPLRFDNNSPVAIPAPGFTNSAVVVSNINFAVNKVTVSLFVSADIDYFLTLDLIAPDGTVCTLTANNGFTGQNYGLTCADPQRTMFDDAALTPISSGVAPFVGSYKPSKPLSVFAGKSGTNVNGVWQLRATDSGSFNLGVIQCWSLSLTPTLCADGGGQCPGADMALDMTGQPTTVIAGDNLTYNIAVTNLGPSTTASVTVTHLLPPNATFISATTPQGTYSQQGGVVTFSLGPMLPRAGASLFVVVQPGDLGTNYPAYSTASVVSEQPDFNLGNNSTTVRTQVTPATADLSVAIAAVPNPVLVDGTLTYTVSLANNGPSPAFASPTSPITVTNALPVSARIQSVTTSRGTASVLGNVVLWSLTNTFVMGASANATITVIPSAEGLITATATAGSGQFDPIAANNTASVSTTVGPAAGLAISLTGFPNPVVAGSNVLYVVGVTNVGPSTATSVVVNQTLPSTFSVVATGTTHGTIAVSSNTVICSITNLAKGEHADITVTAVTATNGVFTTTASVAATQPDPHPANNTASATTTVSAPHVSVIAAEATLTLESGPVNGAIDVGETNTLILRLRNVGNVSTLNLVGTLLATNGVAPVAPNNPQNYGLLAPSGVPVGRSFSFKANGTNGQTITAVLELRDGAVNYAPVSFSFILPTTRVFAKTNVILIPDLSVYPTQLGPATPYPAAINVSGFEGALGRVTVTLSNLTHSYPGDMNVLLVAPGGAKALFMSHAGDQPVENVDLTFDDYAGAPVPLTGQITSGAWRPAAYSPPTALPTNAPAGPYQANLSALSGANPNGLWSLYVYDDTVGDSGAISNGWSLALSTLNLVSTNQGADLALSAVAVPNPVLAGQLLTCAYTITNKGPGSATPRFTTTLPAGVVLDSATPTNFTVAGQTITFADLGKLNNGAYTNVTIVVRPTAAAIPQGSTNTTLATTASVAVDEVHSERDINPSNNSVSFLTALNRPVADLSLAQEVANAVVASFPFTNTVSITNLGPDTALDVVLAYSFSPTNVSLASDSASVVMWTANATNILAHLGALSAGAVATVTAVVIPSPSLIPSGANTAVLTNKVFLSTGSTELAAANNSATNTITVIKPVPHIATAGAVLNYESGPVNGAIDPGETVTLSLGLTNDGTQDLPNLTANLQTTGGVTAGADYPPAKLSNVYGTLVQGGSSEQRFTFKADPNLGGTLVATLQCHDAALGYTTNVSFTIAAVAPATFTESGAITIPDKGVASPYPAVVNVSGLADRRVIQATVTLYGLNHSFPHDLSMLLVSPSGSNVVLMSHAGGAYALNNFNLTFDDAAPGSLPNHDAITAPSYRPAAYEGPVSFPGNPAPQPYGSTLAALRGSSADGAWRLYVYDDANGDAGFIATGWSLTLTNAEALLTAYDPVLSGIFTNGQFQLTVTAQPGFDYVVEGSADLTSWVALSTNSNTTGAFTYTDTTTPTLNSRYYRAFRR